jgi:hypothetical protein
MAPVAAFAARYGDLIEPTLTRGAICFHRFAAVLVVLKTAKR